MIKVAILGYGTVGSGVYNVLHSNGRLVTDRAGQEIEVKYVLDLRDFPGDPVEKVLTHEFEDIINDDEVKIVVEVMGGLHPAFEFTKRCLEEGKNVCTSNKELVAENGLELMSIARENDVNYFFEASCGGGIPIIRALNDCLTADDIDEITGILNGTTNFILTEMTENPGVSFSKVLKQAQENGYAERDPSADIDAHDPARKIAILSSIVFGSSVDYKDIYTEGIRQITAEDIRYASTLGYAVKLLAEAKRTEDGVRAYVAPFLVEPSHPLYAINGVMNAVYVHGNMLGDAVFTGAGAGSLPTASAVVADVIDAARHDGKRAYCGWKHDEKLVLASNDSVKRKYLVRIYTEDEGKANKVFSPDGFLDTISVGELEDEIAFITPELSEEEFSDKVKSFGNVISRIRFY
ncbi:MAG: homoserine dehydrogenase [Lachnospiraceae bacterium]|nr:homoserine dehydrogenase [Lachnospiraceae bacterium]MBQ9607593.1 homoserine dehydrogenase [Lachnospiraceae bacterium]MBR1522860.1 homoserine dehydrogenase [Lachnospiraceae bacterium]